jgi:hypothetical protein
MPQKVLDRINKSAASSDSQSPSVTTNKVTPTSPKRPTIEEAFDAAKKGIAW